MFNQPSPKRNHVWKCPECPNTITLHVRVQHAPICHSKTSHSRRRIEMKRIRTSSESITTD